MGLLWSPILAQQFPISTLQILKLDPFNPGRAVSGDLHELSFNYQQRSLQASGLASGSQFLQFRHKPVGKKKAFCWGFMVINDREHTEGRLAISPHISAKLFENEYSYLALGISAGILNWNSNYLKSRIYTGEDPNLISGSNFIELDAGLGATYHLQKETFGIVAGISANQLPGNLITRQLAGLRILPHLSANGSVLFRVMEGLKVGPRIFYRNTLGLGDAKLKTATTDIGFQAQLEDKGLWFAGSYRMNQSAVNAGLGICILKSDTMPKVEGFANFLDLNFGFTYPLAEVSAFGPTAEVGLAWKFGQRKFERVKKIKYAEPIWMSDEFLTRHRVDRMDPNAPDNLSAKRIVNRKAVYLTYSFPDITRQYIGDAPMVRNDTLLRRIGMEWKGVDGLLENIPEEVIKEVLWPDTTDIVDKENLEPLKKMKWIELSAKLRGDEEAVHFSSGIYYEGELGTNNITGDTLFIGVIFNGLDTMLAIRPGAMTSQLELAALKLHSMRKKLEYELNLAMGEEYRVVWEGAPENEDEDEDDLGIPIMINKLRIVPNNPQMQYFQENTIEMKFRRDPKFKEKNQEREERTVKPSIEEQEGEEIRRIDISGNH